VRPCWLLAAGGTTRARTRCTPASGPTDSACAAIVALADGREQGDGTRGVAAATVDARCRRIGLAHRAKHLKGCLTIEAMVFVDRHDPDLHSESCPLMCAIRARYRRVTVDLGFGSMAGLLYNAFTIRSSARLPEREGGRFRFRCSLAPGWGGPVASSTCADA
jgi:hypothetical protein